MEDFKFLQKMEENNYQFAKKITYSLTEYSFYHHDKINMHYVLNEDGEKFIDFDLLVKSYSNKKNFEKRNYNYARVVKAFVTDYNIMDYNIKIYDNKVSTKKLVEGDIVECRFAGSNNLLCRFAFIVDEINDDYCSIQFIENSESFNTIIKEKCYKFNKVFYNKIMARREKIIDIYKEIFIDELNNDYVNNLKNTIKEFDLNHLQKIVYDLTSLKNKRLKDNLKNI